MKKNHSMAIETTEYEPTFWSDNSLLLNYNFEDDIVSKSVTGETEWDFQYMKEIWDNFEPDFDNDPQNAGMNTKVGFNEVIPKSGHELDSMYLNTTALLSPISMVSSSPSSPANIIDEKHEQNLNLTEIANQEFERQLFNNSSALELLNKILTSPNTLNEDIDIDTALNSITYLTDDNVVEIEEQSNDNTIEENLIDLKIENTGKNTTKKQVKRKSTDSEWSPSKRTKKSAVNSDIKKERKKSQNKSAANRYRMKKRVEQESVEFEQELHAKKNEELKQALEKIQMEYKVVHPLAEAAFAGDPKRKILLLKLHNRVLNDNLLD